MRSSLWANLLGLTGVLCRRILDVEHFVRIKEMLLLRKTGSIGTLPPSVGNLHQVRRENAQDKWYWHGQSPQPRATNLPEWEEAQKYGSEHRIEHT
jgi:hypothetical protein